MRILMVTTSPPYPATSGGALRAFGILKGLVLAGHEVSLFTLADAPLNPALTTLCAHTFSQPVPRRTRIQRLRTLLLSGDADIAHRLYSKRAADALAQVLHEHTYDIVQYEGIEAGCYLPIGKRAAPHSHHVFDTFNAEAQLQHTIYTIERAQPRRLPMAVYSWLQSRRIARYEGMLCRLADAVCAVSEEDAALLAPYRDDRRIHIVPSGIWVDSYQDGMPTALQQPALVFTGKMDYRPNVDAVQWFCDAILPKLEGAHLYIVGQQPAASVQALAGARVIVTGSVPSVLPFLYGAQVYVAPLRMGSGTRLKLLEAMACGCAIVATTLAAAGLTQEADSALVIADDADGFAAAVRALLVDPDRRAALGEAARACVRQRFDWSVIVPRLLAVYAELSA